VTVLEEAHHLLKKTSPMQSAEGNGMLDKSVEMLANVIAEMRTYGEGFFVVDQAPGLLDTSVIRNTNTKIMLRTPDYGDRLLVGKAAGLNEGQIEEVAKLPLGVAAVYQNNWTEPVLCKMEPYPCEKVFVYQPHKQNDSDGKKLNTELVKWMLLGRVSEKVQPDFDVIEKYIDILPMATPLQLHIKRMLASDDRIHAWDGWSFQALAQRLADVLGCKKEIGYRLRQGHSTQQMQQSMDELQKELLGKELPESLRLEMNHCFMKVYSQSGEDELKKYYQWDFEIRNKLL
jgi:hypothetical protein